MGFEGKNFAENANEGAEVLNDNIKLIDETLAKLGYKLDYVDGKAGRIYKATDDTTNKLNVYGGFRGVPKDKKLTQEDIVGAIFDSNGDVRSDQATQQINELLGINLPKRFDRYEVGDLKGLAPYIRNYKTISYEEFKGVKDTIIYQIREQTGVMLDEDFSFDGNITTMGSGLVLMIDGKWVNRRDDNFGKVKSINVNFTRNKVDIIVK